MKCDDTRKVLEDLYEGLLDERTAAEARAHLAECGACRREAAAIEKLNSALVAVKVVAAPRGVADRTLEAVRRGRRGAGKDEAPEDVRLRRPCGGGPYRGVPGDFRLEAGAAGPG